MRKLQFTLIIISIIVLSGNGFSRIIHIPADFPLIQQGINAASSGDTVLVATGIYHEHNIMLKDGVIVKGAGIDQSIVDGDSLTVFWGADNAVLEGFTIRNAYKVSEKGIFCWSTKPIISNNKITNCYSAISVADNAIIKNNIIINNISYGIFAGNSSPSIMNNLIVNSDGALVSVSSDFFASNNTLDSNDRGVWIQRSSDDLTPVSTIVINNIVTRNNWYGIYLASSEEYGVNPLNQTIKYNDVWNNSTNYSNNWAPDASDISANPRFVNPVGLVKMTNQYASESYKISEIIQQDIEYRLICETKNRNFVRGGSINTLTSAKIAKFFDLEAYQVTQSDYHLQDNSPCIGIGTNAIEIDGNLYHVPSTDIEANRRPNPPGSNTDLGAYENPLGKDGSLLISVSTNSINYGNIQIGDNSLESNIVIRHIGTGYILSSDISIVGNHPNDFQITQGVGSFNLSPGQSYIIKVRFAPTDVGSRSAGLRITHNATNESSPIDVSLEGIGTPDIFINVNPRSINFESVQVGQSSSEGNFTIKHTGTHGTLIGTVEKIGNHPNDFQITQGIGSFSLSPGQLYIIKVRFAPTDVGSRSAGLRITHNATNESSPIDVSLEGIGTPDIKISVSPSSITFDSTKVGKSSSEIMVVIQHIGMIGTLTGAVEIGGNHPNDFQLTQGSGPFSLSPSQSVTIKVKFTPTEIGFRDAVLRITHNAINKTSPVEVVLIGIGTVSVPIKPIVSSPPPHIYGSEFWIEIMVGDGNRPVSNLFGLSFDLNFTNSEYIDVVMPHSENVIPGDFLGTDILFIWNVNEDSGKVSIGISQKAGAIGVSDSGIVAKVKFKSDIYTPIGTEVIFNITNFSANDPSGRSIDLVSDSTKVVIEGFLVWPGDTDNNGVVNQADVLPLGLYWAKTGPARFEPSINWFGQPALPWAPPNATYADANGNGTVNQADVLPIGLNWGKTHFASVLAQFMYNLSDESTLLNPTLKPIVSGYNSENNEYSVSIFAEGVIDLFGVAFELHFTQKEAIDNVYAHTSADSFLLGDDVVDFSFVEKDSSRIGVGISRKAGQGGVSGDGIIANIFLGISPSTLDSTNIVLTLKNITANNSQGSPIQFEVRSDTIITEIRNVNKQSIPNEFILYQNYPNPFNPTTSISFGLPKTCNVLIEVYNLSGQKVKTLLNDRKQAGRHLIIFDAKNDNGAKLPTGIYLYIIRAGDFREVKKLTLLK